MIYTFTQKISGKRLVGGGWTYMCKFQRPLVSFRATHESILDLFWFEQKKWMLRLWAPYLWKLQKHPSGNLLVNLWLNPVQWTVSHTKSVKWFDVWLFSCHIKDTEFMGPENHLCWFPPSQVHPSPFEPLSCSFIHPPSHVPTFMPDTSWHVTKVHAAGEGQLNHSSLLVGCQSVIKPTPLKSVENRSDMAFPTSCLIHGKACHYITNSMRSQV